MLPNAQVAFASSVSMCIAGANFSLTRTTTSPRIAVRSELILTETICLSDTPYSLASSGVMWMWRLAAITPSVRTYSLPFSGLTSLQPGVPATSPLSRIGALRPMVRASVSESSTWLAEPRTMISENRRPDRVMLHRGNRSFFRVIPVNSRGI